MIRSLLAFQRCTSASDLGFSPILLPSLMAALAASCFRFQKRFAFCNVDWLVQPGPHAQVSDVISCSTLRHPRHPLHNSEEDLFTRSGLFWCAIRRLSKDTACRTTLSSLPHNSSTLQNTQSTFASSIFLVLISLFSQSRRSSKLPLAGRLVWLQESARRRPRSRTLKP